MEFRLRPTNNFVNEADWQELHTLSLHWKSDMAFYSDELRFLRKLIDKYFVWLMKAESIKATQDLLNRLTKTQSRAEDIVSTIDKHVKHIAKEIKYPLVHNDKAFRDEHAELEELIAAFVKDFRVLKKKVFDLTEDVLVEEKIKHLAARYED
ncbi:MAG: hypothetical protein RIC95_14110 [Vicingaceae bacterium]